MKKLFVMLALAWGTMGAFAQTETDSAAVVNKGITPVKEVYPQKEEDGDLYHGLTRKLTFDRMIPPYGLEVTYDKTTHIIFPSSVRYVLYYTSECEDQQTIDIYFEDNSEPAQLYQLTFDFNNETEDEDSVVTADSKELPVTIVGH